VPKSSAQVSQRARLIPYAAGEGQCRCQDLLLAAGLSQSSNNYRRHVMPLIESGLLAMSTPDRPRSSNQRYLLTNAGKRLLASLEQVQEAWRFLPTHQLRKPAVTITGQLGVIGKNMGETLVAKLYSAVIWAAR